MKIINNKLLFLGLLLSLFVINTTKAQLFGNEWINYSQSYYKFRVYKDSIYRISISQLTALGMPSTVVGDNLQLFRDGVEVPVFVSNNGTLTATDYIEFYGEKANGNLDIRLYQNPNLQLNKKINLTSDTAYYFVTFNNLTTNKRFVAQTNNVVSPPLKEDFFWNKVSIDYRNFFQAGSSDPSGQGEAPVNYHLNSSQYEEEGYAKILSELKDSIKINCPNAYTVSGGPFGYFKSNVVGNSYLTNHRVIIYANGNQIADSTFDSFAIKRFSLSVPMSYINAQNAINFAYEPKLGSIDRIGISNIEFRYPSTYNFSNNPMFYFELDPKLTDYYLEISNFNNGSSAPKLYDLTSNTYLIGDIGTAGLIKFVIPASTTVKKLVLANSTTYGNVIGIENVMFKNFSQTANQGNYIIVTHRNYTNDGNGNDNVAEYQKYRSSAAGGAYNSIISFTDDIFNEFGYGYDFSTLAVKNFLNYAYASSAWTDKPSHVLMLGKGISYHEYLQYKASPYSSFPYYAIPSFGDPCSDWLLTDFTKTNKPEIAIGRVSLYNGTDIKTYLDKVKDYEIAVNSTNNQTADNKLWQKSVLHIAGAKDITQQTPIVNSLTSQEKIIGNPYYGGITTTIKKGTTAMVETANSQLIDNLFNNGLGFVQFFGHSSQSSLDYNLDKPSNYLNYKKYPVFLANGCSAGNIFSLTGQKYLSEDFVLAPNAGSICFIANVNTGFSGTLGYYTDSLYYNFSFSNYGKSLGTQMRSNNANLINNNTDGLLKLHCQQIQINGDPAITTYSYPKPDYDVEVDQVTFKQIDLNTSLDTIDADILIHNLGKYTTDSVSVLIKRVLPNNTEFILLNTKYPGIANSDTLHVKIPILGNIALGQNYLSVEIDQEGYIEEISENNNSIKKYFTIYNDDLVPVYPYDFSIVSTQGVTLKGSTLNPFASQANYYFQIDTTEKFNSPLMQSTLIPSKGGVIKWQPTITLKDNVVYYWRTAKDSSSSSQAKKWSNSSFIYIDQSLPGWNQSHYFQLKKDNYSSMYLDSTSRSYKFVGTSHKLSVQNVCLNGPDPYNYVWDQYWVKLDGQTEFQFGCDPWPGFFSLEFVVIDTLTGQPWMNKRPVAGVDVGRFGSFAPCRNGVVGEQEDPFFEFSFGTASYVQGGPQTNGAVWRKKIMDFIDSIPSGYYVMFQPRLCIGTKCGGINTTFINQWKADTTLYGSNNSLYHKIKNMGFTQIDSFYKNRTMIFWTQKNRPATVQQIIGDASQILYKEFNFNSTLFNGTITSTKIGPAKVWSEFKQIRNSLDIGVGDTSYFDIYGVSNQGTETLLATVQHDTSLAFINTTQHPFLKLVMRNADNKFQTPEQLSYWRILYQPQPEAALNPNRYLVVKDSIGQGQNTKFAVAVENLSTIPMDSLLVKYSLIDNNNKRTLLGTKRYKPLPILDTIIVDYDINSSLFSNSSNNTFEVEINPDFDQPEQYHPNNIGLRTLYISPDNTNPLLDVTFDGIHILNKDIVSAKPLINIILKDENKYLALDDTSLIQVTLRTNSSGAYTDEIIHFDNSILKFIPATLSANNKNNQAKVEYRPTFTKDGDDYMLIVHAKDKKGNTVATNDYKIVFRVVTTPSISSLLNYPNPFTTSTQFLFTITGTEVPSNLKIQILSPTGKVVREITKGELGDLHIGKNLTEFRWKGDDQYGQPLGNGVYLYRLVSNVNGSKMDHFDTGADKWIKNGFGKLYIMR